MLLVVLLGLVRAGGLSRVCRGCSRSCGRYSRSRSLCEHSSGKQGGERCSNELLFHDSKTLRGCLTVSRLACRDYLFNASSPSVLTRIGRKLWQRGKYMSGRFRHCMTLFATVWKVQKLEAEPLPTATRGDSPSQIQTRAPSSAHANMTLLIAWGPTRANSIATSELDAAPHSI
ncbi:hypothetical protein AWB64_04340 [Caballeronia sordidicola]|uniref:Uncharacterized protein n=1 Tax=Caballeronia sordidicola TaxID=196367 RepID=A0A158H988_CABSO|nr:hypothetical protein AWB64_04340 [Caballeronia sordidicola]